MSDFFKRLSRLLHPAKRKPHDAFLEMCGLYEARLKRFPLPPRNASPRGKVGVLVTPWLSTGVPLFNLECALMLVREGFHVAALSDDSNVIRNNPTPEHSTAIAKILQQLMPSLDVVRVDRLPAGEPDAATAQTILEQNAIWRMRGEAKADEFIDEHPNAVSEIATHIGRISRMLRELKLDWIFIPGGIFGLSGMYVAAARGTGTSFTTYDAAVGVLRLSQDSVAAHLGDVPRTFSELQARWQEDPSEQARVLDMARAEIDDRTAARDFRQFQVAQATQRDDLRYDILVPLNIRWDSAALSRQRIFASVEQWLVALLDWVSARPDVSICIRQHPRERLGFAKGSDDLAPLLERYSALGERVRFVAAADEINTYDLLRHVKVVLPHTSTIGIEAAFLGKPVVIGTSVYYEDFGFVQRPATRDEYFAKIADALGGEIVVTEQQRAAAGCAYFLTQRCTLIRSQFNPHREQLVEWVTQEPEAIWGLPETADLRTALLTRQPLSMIRYQRLASL